jgi:hypothetical protein
MNVSYHNADPFRLPSWRYDAALRLLDQYNQNPHLEVAFNRRSTDTFVRDAYEFSRIWQNLRIDDYDNREQDFQEAYDYNKHMFTAFQLHLNPDSEMRSIVEASVLAGESNKNIQERTGIKALAIRLYEKLFFNVRDRLKHDYYIIKMVLATAAASAVPSDGSWTPLQKDLTYKLFAYKGGPIVFDLFLCGFQVSGMPRNVKEAGPWIDAAIESGIKRQTAMASRLLEVNKYNVMQLFDVYLRIVERQQQAAKADGGVKADWTRNVETFLNEIPWSTGKSENSKKMTKEQKSYELTAVEPRADEMLSLAQGVLPASLTVSQ